MLRVLADAWYTPVDLAEGLSIPESTQEKLRTRGQITYVKRGSRVLYRGVDVQAYLDRCEEVPASAELAALARG